MPYTDIAEQSGVEHGLLKSITDSLRLAIGWKLEGKDVSRKLSTVRFVAQSLQRHLDHLFALEEYDGYMDVVVSVSPQLGRRVDALRHEHDQLRHAVARTVQGLERVVLTDQGTLDEVCAELLGVLQQLDEHTQKEARLLQQALKRDGGGEG
jgi:hemerythrin-like domain-containing protein